MAYASGETYAFDDETDALHLFATWEEQSYALTFGEQVTLWLKDAPPEGTNVLLAACDSRGRMLAAAVGIGIFDSLAQGAEQMVRAARYDARYRFYCNAYEAPEQARMFDQLAQLSARSMKKERKVSGTQTIFYQL